MMVSSFLLFTLAQLDENRLAVDGRQEGFQQIAGAQLERRGVDAGVAARQLPLDILVHQQLHLVFGVVGKPHDGGDTVLYGKYAGTELDVEGTKYLIMRQSDVLAVLG